MKLQDLGLLVEYLNKLTNNPKTPYTKNGAGYKQNSGHYYVQQQEGGYRLEQLGDRGTRDVTPFRGTKQQVFDWIHAFIDGYEEAGRK